MAKNEEFEDIEFDELRPVVEEVVEIVEEPEVVNATVEPLTVPAPASITRTDNFYSSGTTLPVNNEVEDLGLQIIQPDQQEARREVSVNEEIGPCYPCGPQYGEIHLLKDKRYRIDTELYQYLYDRKKLVGQ